MMRSFSLSQQETLAASQTSSNVLNGTRLQPAIGNGYITVWAVGSVAGITMKLLAQSDEVCSDYRISDANRYPNKEYDVTIENIPVKQGDVLNLTFTDTAGAGGNVQWIIDFTPAQRMPAGGGFRRR